MVKKDEEQLLDIQHTTLLGNQRKNQEYDGDSMTMYVVYTMIVHNAFDWSGLHLQLQDLSTTIPLNVVWHKQVTPSNKRGKMIVCTHVNPGSCFLVQG